MIDEKFFDDLSIFYQQNKTFQTFKNRIEKLQQNYNKKIIDINQLEKEKVINDQEIENEMGNESYEKYLMGGHHLICLKSILEEINLEKIKENPNENIIYYLKDKYNRKRNYLNKLIVVKHNNKKKIFNEKKKLIWEAEELRKAHVELALNHTNIENKYDCEYYIFASTSFKFNYDINNYINFLRSKIDNELKGYPEDLKHINHVFNSNIIRESLTII